MRLRRASRLVGRASLPRDGGEGGRPITAVIGPRWGPLAWCTHLSLRLMAEDDQVRNISSS